MRNLIEWAVRRPALINVIILAVLVLGFVSMYLVPKEVFPESSLDLIYVRMTYRGAGPREIEKGILLKIEESVQGITGIGEIRSEARENIGTVQIEVASGANTTKVLRDIKDQIEQITSFPKDADKAAIYEIVRKSPVASLALYGNLSRASLQTIAERIKDDLLAKPDIEFVQVKGAKEREISIEVNEEKLRKYNLQIAEIGRALSLANFDLSGGVLKTRKEDYILRIYGKRYLAKEIENIVVKTLPGGTLLRIRDIARTKETFADTPQTFYFNGKRALRVDVLRSSTGNSLTIGETTIAYAKEAKKILPSGVKLVLQRDFNTPLRDRIALLMKNGMQGLVLVLLTLTLLMNVRLAFWVAFGLPVALLGSFIFFSPANITVNVLSLFGLILVIGILVDDAIVVAENVYSHLEMGKHPVRAAIDGTAEVLPAVFAAVTTTMLAFSPLFFMGGIIGKFISAIPGVVCISLFLSLFESFLFLPPHLAHSLKQHDDSHQPSTFRQKLDAGFQWLNAEMYAGTLKTALKNRWAVLALGIAMFMITVGMLRGGMVKMLFFPRIDSDQIVARFIMEPGTPRTRTHQVTQKLERIAVELGKELEKKYGRKIILARTTWVGLSSLRTVGFSSPSGEEVGEVQLELLPGEQRSFSSFDIVNMWRKRTGSIIGATKLSFGSFGGPPLGRALEFRLLSNNDRQLKEAALFLRKKLGTFAGVSDAEDDMELGKRELRFKLTPLGKSLGLSMQELALQIRYRISGQEVMRLQRGRDEVRVYVRYPLENRKSLKDLEQLWIRTRRGQRIPLKQLATWSYTRDVKSIRRINRQRVVTVAANLDDNKGNRQDIFRELQSKTFMTMARQMPRVTIDAAGQSKEQGKVFGGMKVAFPIMLFGIFIILVAIFQSYAQSVLILSGVIFGFIGAVWGHFIVGLPMTILSFFGLVGLSGMVVNDSLVLMDKLNRLILHDGYGVFEAAWQAGQSRLRAILSTTLTTFMGLAPLLFEKSQQAQFLIPMAISIAFGIVFATFITLILVPSLYLITGDIRCFFRWMRTGRWPAYEEVDPIVKLRKERQQEH